MEFKARLNNDLKMINEAITRWVPSSTEDPKLLHEAMHYSLFAGGKRLRPILLLASHAIKPASIDPMPAAVAFECVHTYSLIHDDLPCMDDSDYRRGLLSCHKKFDEATAVLAGDALIPLAFELLADHYKAHPSLCVQLVKEVSNAAGSQKLVGGQVLDILNDYEQSKVPTESDIEAIYARKTAALMQAAIVMGLQIAGQDASVVTLGRDLGYHLGMAYQIIDDILDMTSSQEELGKPAGIDSSNNKCTYPSIFGLEFALEKMMNHSDKAIHVCRAIGNDNSFFIELIDYLRNRLN